MKSFEVPDQGVGIEHTEAEVLKEPKVAAGDEKSVEDAPVSSEYDQALLNEGLYKTELDGLREKIKDAEKDRNEAEVLRLENSLRVSERKLSATKEFIREKEEERQAFNRTQREKEGSELMAEWNKAADQHKEDTHERAVATNQGIDRMNEWKENNRKEADLVYDEAETMNDKFVTYQEDRQSALRSLKYYSQGSRKIARQRALVGSLNTEEAKVQEEKCRAQVADFEAKGIPFTDPEVQKAVAAWREAQKTPDRRKTELATLATMEQVMPAQEADAEKFFAQYWGNSFEEHQAAEEKFSEEVKHIDHIEGLLNLVSSWGAIPEGNKFLTNTKFRADLDVIFALDDENEKIKELEKVTKNDEFCEKLLALYRKEREETLTPVEEESLPDEDAPIGQHKRKVSKEIDPRLLDQFNELVKEEEKFEELNKFVSSDRFRFFPQSFLLTSDGRKKLKALEDMNIPNVESSPLFGISMRLHKIQKERERLGKILHVKKRGSTAADLRGSVLIDYPTEQGSLPKKGNFVSRFFSNLFGL